MAFFQQLRLLLWKNWLTIIRQPLWSLTLVIWPLIIFIIIAVTRTQFPPITADTCYAGPRNLPSTGFFPFLQTLMCTSDSNCHTTPRSSYQTAPQRSRARNARSSHGETSLLAKFFEGDLDQFQMQNTTDPAHLVEVFQKLLGQPRQPRARNSTSMYANTNQTLGDQEALQEMMGSLHLLKRMTCSIALPLVNVTPPSPLGYSVVTFCTSNNTLFEAALHAIDQVLTELMLTEPEQISTLGGAAVLVLDQLQKETSVWDTLLALPGLFTFDSVEELMGTVTNLLTNIQRVLSVIENNFPQVNGSLSSVHTPLASSISLLNYLQNWPGKNVTIPLGDVIMPHNGSLGSMWQELLQYQIPLDEAVVLILDKDLVRWYLCNSDSSSSSGMFLTAACSAGIVDTVLDWISPELLAKRTVLAWSKHVAHKDLLFAKTLVHSLMGFGFPTSEGDGGPDNWRKRRSEDGQPQTIDEELFLEVGTVLMEIVKMVPELNMVAHQILSVGIQSMQFATLILQTVEDTAMTVLSDANQLQQTYLTLLTNETQSVSRVAGFMDTAMDAINKSMTSESLTCEEILRPFQWLLDASSTTTVLKSVICQNVPLEQILLTEFLPLVHKALEFNRTFEGLAGRNVTLPMILSEWHRVYRTGLRFVALWQSLPDKLGEAFWNNWLVDSSQAVGTLYKSVFLSLVNFGERLETTPLWPQVRVYFQMVDWIFNYDIADSNPPCTFNIFTGKVVCNSEFKWPEFVQISLRMLTSPSEYMLVDSLKGTLRLLQSLFGSTYKHLAESSLDGVDLIQDPLAAYLKNLLYQADTFVSNVTKMPNWNITNPDVMLPLVNQLLQSTGLQPLMPLLLGDCPLNASAVIKVASEIGRLNQKVFAFNESDPTMAELERLIFSVLSLESNLTISLSHIMGHSVLTYSEYFNPEYVAKLREMLKPFTAQTSSGLVEAILSAMELLNTVLDSADPNYAVLSYIQQIEEFVMSLYKLQRIHQLPQGVDIQVTDLQLITDQFLGLLTPVGLEALMQVGPDMALDIVIQKFVPFLPPVLQKEAHHFLLNFKALLAQMAQCEDAPRCLAGVSEVFTFIDQIINMTLSTDGHVAIKIVESKSLLRPQEYEEVASAAFRLLLSEQDAALAKTFQNVLRFIRIVIALPDINVSTIQAALATSDVTIEQLDGIATLAGAADMKELLMRVMAIVDVQKCFGDQSNAAVTVQCVGKLIDRIAEFLTKVPALRNETLILTLIPQVINGTINQVMPINPSAEPDAVLVHILNTTLANVKASLEQNHLNTPAIMNELKMLENLILLLHNRPALDNNMTADNQLLAQKQYLELINVYLERLAHITSNSSVSELLQPVFHLAQMQVTMQLAQADLSLFVSSQIEHLMGNLTFPLDGKGLREIGLASLQIFNQVFELTLDNLEAVDGTQHITPFLNLTVLHAIRHQVKIYVGLIEMWMKQPEIPAIFTSMLQWGDSSLVDLSHPVQDLHHLMQSVGTILSQDELNFLYMINNITGPLSEALMVAEKPGGLHSDRFIYAVLDVINAAMHILSADQPVFAPSVQQSILEVVHYSLKLVLQPDTNFDVSRNISIHILKNTKYIIQETMPDFLAYYLVSGIKVLITYFDIPQMASGPDKWNYIILNELMTIQSILPENNPAQLYLSVLINVTRFILESGQGDKTLWEVIETASTDDLPVIIGHVGQLLNILRPLLTGIPHSSTTTSSIMNFAHLAPVLEQVITGNANQDTWNNLEKMIEALLLMLRDTELSDAIPSFIQVFENVTRSLVRVTQAENVLLLSLQRPVMTLMMEIAKLVNTTFVDLSKVVEGMQLAIENTVKAAQQANGALKCSDVLAAWEPVRLAVGLTPAAMSAWCSVSVQPVIDAYNAAWASAGHPNMSHMGVGTMALNATAARMVEALRAVYQVSLSQSHALEQLVMNISSQFFLLSGQPLSHEAQLHWVQQLQMLQLQNSLSSIQMLADELLKVAPSLQPYVSAVQAALDHVLAGSHLLYNGGSATQALFSEAAMIFLSSLDIVPGNATWGDLSGMDLAGMINDTIGLMIDLEIFGYAPELYRALERFRDFGPSEMARRLHEVLMWLASTEESGLDLIFQVLPRIYDAVRPLMSVFTQAADDLPLPVGLFEDLARNVLEMLRQMSSTSNLLAPPERHHPMFAHQFTQANHTGRRRQRREAVPMPPRSPIDDFVDLFNIDYATMFYALSQPVSTMEILETAHVFFANPDLGVVLNGVTRDMPWNWEVPREETIGAALGVMSFLTHPTTFQMPSMDLLLQTVNLIPEAFPFSSEIKNITQALASEPQESLILMQQAAATAGQLFLLSPAEQEFSETFDHLTSQVCTLEQTQFLRLVLQTVSLQPGELCHTILPSMQVLLESLARNVTSLSDLAFQTFIGDPKTYNFQSSWSSVFSQGLGFNTSTLTSLNVTITPIGVVTFGEMMRNKTAFAEDAQKYVGLDPHVLSVLMDSPVPNNNLEILSRLLDLRHCNSTGANSSDPLCSLSPPQMYAFMMLTARHANVEKAIYRLMLSEEMQGMVGVLLQVADVLTKMMKTFMPAITKLQDYLYSVADLNLVADVEFSEMSRGLRSKLSSRATFVTLSKALCSKGIMALFGISQLPIATEMSPSTSDNAQREEMIERFKIPRTASPFCMNMYLDMVNTTGGAIAWAFLKPMLMGQILYSPDTPITRSIMEKANATLREFANLSKYSYEWLDSSNYIVNSAQILGQTLPMLQNSLGNPFVKNFIEMQTDINVDKMKETLSSFSNMTHMLEKNKHILKQITTLSSLMVNISSCIKFDRYRGYDSVDELNDVAADLAKNRDLYASVIFDLNESGNASRRHRSARSPSAASPLPPRVSYTIRMHMDNVMRTDRVRKPFFTKEAHIDARMTMRYNRGFVYLQENIDRAIIETQAGRRVSEPAVQLQPFPYPCHFRDEYLEAISFVFPLMLMMAWVLFVADFVKKLVHERELRLHEYMKMMGVNPLSHFFAWFLECATYLLITIVVLTLVLRYGGVLPKSDGFLLFLYFCDYGLSVLAFSYLVGSFFDKTYIAGLSGSLVYVLCFFPFIIVMAVESSLSFSQKSALSLFSPTCFSYASQYISRYESQGEGLQWSNSYTSPIYGDTASFGWLCWLMLIDSLLYFFIGAYIRMVFPGKYGIAAPWYFPFKASFWADLCFCSKKNRGGRGLLFNNIMHQNQPVFMDEKGKGHSALSSQAGEDFSDLPVGVALHGLSKIYGDRVAIQNLNVSFHQGHVTSLLGHNGAGKTTTMSLLTGLFAPSSGSIEVYGRDMQSNIDDIRKDLGVCMQYDVLFEHMTTKEHLLLYGQIKAPHWTKRELREQVRAILEETGMYAHRHKRAGTLSGGMRRKLSISIAFIGGSRLVVLDEPTTGVDPCSRRSIWDIVIQHKKNRTIIMSTHHLDEAEVLSDRIAFLERGGLKCCGSPLYLKDKLGQGYNLTLSRKKQSQDSESMDNAELKSFVQAHIPEARLKEAQRGDLVYSLPPFGSSNASAYRSLLTALDANLDALQLGGYGISDTTLEEVFLQLTQGASEEADGPLSISETLSDSASIDSCPSDLGGSFSSFGDKINLTGSSTVSGVALAWQQLTAILIKRFHHSRRDWKGLISQLLLPVLFVVFAMGLGSIRSDLRHYPKMELSPALYKFDHSYAFFSNQNPSSSPLIEAMMSFPGIDNTCLDHPDNRHCHRNPNKWTFSGNSSGTIRECKCTSKEQICDSNSGRLPRETLPSSQVVYNLSTVNVETYLAATANEFVRNRYGGFSFGMPLPPDLQLDIRDVPKNRTLSKVWFNPEGHHTMPAYLNSLNNLILRSNLPADKDPRQYAISVSSQPYFGRKDDEDTIVEGILHILVGLCVLTGFSITTASFAIYEVSEHHSGSKRLQHIAGISEAFYWAVNFFYDMVMYLIPVTLTVCVIAAFQIPAFTDRQNLGAVSLLLVLFGFSTFPWMYLLSGAFKDAEMAFITYVCINLFLSINTILSTSILHFLSQISLRSPELIQDIFEKLCHALLIFPQFSFGNGLMHLARMDIEVQILSGYGVDAYKNPFGFDALGWMFVASFIQGLVFFSLRLLLNKYIIRKVSHFICGRRTVPQVSIEDVDEDVSTEHHRVASGAADSDILQVNQLTKVYQHLNKKIPAVKSLSVGIPAGECFGLLGVNGAGKTTTFKMLTGDVRPTGGTAQIRDRDGRLVDIMECRKQGINIGYCPQVDALDDLLTGEEHLYFYGRIRGISKRELDGVVSYLLKRLELQSHRGIVTDGYSCGTRRKLSTALALIGHPQILLLDEPSSGMDPRTKRHLWKIISEEVKGKCAVVLTSHSMEECEALCGRLAIMVKGQFRCLGSLQHIKSRFGSGFTVKMYLAGASCNTEAITSFMQRRFPSTYLKDQHSTMVEYHVPVAPGGVADIFSQLESNKNALQIKHFSVSQTTLDEVFINFALGNFGMENVPINSEDENDDPASIKAVDA